MRECLRLSIGIVLLFFICTIMCAPALAAQDQKVITVVLDNNYPPYSFLDKEGNLQGILVDEWNLWEQKTGIHAELHGVDWGDALRRMKAGEFDVIDTIFFNEERAKIYDFTPSYATIDVPIFFNRNIAGISSPETARGFVVAAKTGDNAVEVLKKSGVDQVLEFNSYEEIIQAAKDGRVVVFCVDEPPAMYFLYKMGIRDQFFKTEPLYTGAFHRAVRKGNTETLKRVEDGFSKISPSEHSDIERKWYGTPLVSTEYMQYVIAGGLVILIILSVLMIVNRTLKRTVAQRTAELKAELEQRKQAEEALRENEAFLDNIIENIPDMIFVKDATDLRFVRFNRAGEDLLGYSRKELSGKNDYDFFPKVEADFFTGKDREVLRNLGIHDISREKIMTRYKGERILHTKKIPICDNNNTPKYLLGISYDITEHVKAEEALAQARKKLNLLNTITFQDIQNALFSLKGYLELQKDLAMDEKAGAYVKKEREVAEKISNALAFARNYQDMGIKPPFWQNANQVFLLAISHLDLSKIARNVSLDNLELYADPLLETVFFNLAGNVMRHGKTATEITLHYRETTESLTLFIEDNGAGIPDADKEKIFERGYGTQKGMGLFLVREILGITGITIREIGEPGKGARFEMTVPKGAYRLTEDR